MAIIKFPVKLRALNAKLNVKHALFMNINASNVQIIHLETIIIIVIV